MPTNFPATAIDTFTTWVDGVDYPTAAQFNNLQESVVAIQTKAGINSSAVNTTVDFKLSTIAAGEKAVDIGDMKMTARATAPTGWLLCDGASLLRAGTYAALFTAISTTFGTADATHFNIPDMRGRAPVGVGTGTGGGASGTGLPTGGSALTARALGGWIGAETHTLTIAELAVHTHVQDSHNHTQDSHLHTVAHKADDQDGSGSNGSTSGTSNTGATVATNQAATAVNQNAGSGTAHNNIQPITALNFVIKF